MLSTLSLALFAAVIAASAHAQGTSPNNPIRCIIPYAAGGGTDVVARPIALKAGEVLGVPIVYENRGGGGGLIAGETVAKAPADGYTLLVGSGNTHVFPTLLWYKIPYDPVKDYAPITNFVVAPNILVAHPSFQPKTVQEIVAYGKANPNKINWASSGNGAGGHLALVLFAKEAGIQVLHVPFKGAGPAVTALLSGETQLLFANTGVFLGHIQAGKLRPVATAALTRIALLPNVPTLHESGFKGFESSTAYGLLAPAGTPKPIINKLHDELVKIVKSPESVKRLESVGAIPVANSPAEFADYNRREVAKWGKIIRENNIKPD